MTTQIQRVNYEELLSPIKPWLPPSCIGIFRLFDKEGNSKTSSYTFYANDLIHFTKRGRISINGQIVKPFNIVFLHNAMRIHLPIFVELMSLLPRHKSLHIVKDTHPELFV